MTATGLVCAACGVELRDGDKFCHECGAPVTVSHKPAEYKQVTVLFADVVHSMDIAAAVGTERLREVMTELVNRASVVVQRYGGTVDKFTGDGIMALFGAPVALEITLFARVWPHWISSMRHSACPARSNAVTALRCSCGSA